MVGGVIKKFVQTFIGNNLNKLPFFGHNQTSSRNRLALISTFKPLEHLYQTFSGINLKENVISNF